MRSTPSNVVDCFYIALLSALQQTYCALVACDSKLMSDCSFLQQALSIHPSGVFTSLFGCYKWCIYIVVWFLQVVYLHHCLVVTSGVFTSLFGCYKWCIYIAVWLLQVVYLHSCLVVTWLVPL